MVGDFGGGGVGLMYLGVVCFLGEGGKMKIFFLRGVFTFCIPKVPEMLKAFKKVVMIFVYKGRKG